MNSRNSALLLVCGLTAIFALTGCSAKSFFVYRLPYENNTEVKIWQDHLTHSGGLKRIDMAGVNGTALYKVVAAQAGTVRFIVDSNSLNCCGGTCDNNYVWIQNIGAEWTKYSHLATNSVSGSAFADLSVDDTVTAGQYIGIESDVGRACGSPSPIHLHFEVLVPTDQDNPVFNNSSTGNIVGENKIPRFCGVPGLIAVKGETYTASACPN